MRLTENAAQGLALFVRESLDSGDVSHNDLQTWLADAVRDYGKANPGSSGYGYCYLVDFIGDGESGDVIFCSNGEMQKCGYEILTVGGKVTAQLDDENIVDVLPHTIYEEEADEEDHYASMESAKLYQPNAARFIERFISKSARDAADSSSFAGKGKSFPILKSSDVMAAVRSMGRAGSDNHPASTIKKNIIRIAKAKGFSASLPKAWQAGGDQKEAAETARALVVEGVVAAIEADKGNAFAQAIHDKAVKAANQKSHDSAVKMGAECPPACKMGKASSSEAAASAPADVRLIESAGLPEKFELRESAAVNPLVKIISAGRGTSGYYSEDLLKRDGPKIFTRGTLMYVNHATKAEEAARPEGDWEKLAAVTVGDAYWDAKGKDGPALYAPAKVFSGFADEVREKAPFTGVSIRAGGKRDDSAIAPDGKPGVITALTSAESIDLVTKAGRDGKLLLESATPQQESSDMTDAEQQQLREALAEVKKMKERQAAVEAGGAVAEYLRSVQVSAAIAERVSGRVLAGSIPLTEAGDLDRAKVKQFAETQLTEELAFLRRINPGLVVGMGPKPSTTDPATVRESEKHQKANRKALKEADKRFAHIMGFEGRLGKQGRKILSEGRSAFDPNYNARQKGAIVTGEMGTMGLEG